ncbi:origin recognition complex subunit 2-domain-containing protein [Coniella lustricola]|uniref:Origin recognition complex subunit 2 n=1 Tax=Coniella lustricola TaxID=2025994 RepID=A0A2T2ZV13_9PEZI|nr:origin recognition complex subunit 2-domain-containing protein [Coniella lustricola]
MLEKTSIPPSATPKHGRRSSFLLSTKSGSLQRSLQRMVHAMPRQSTTGPISSQESPSKQPQRKREGIREGPDDTKVLATPSKRRKIVRNDTSKDGNGGTQPDRDELAGAEVPATVAVTPKRRGRPPKAANHANGSVSTPTGPRSAAKAKLETPSRSKKGVNGLDTPGRRTIADRSARRKSARALIDRVLGDAVSDDDEDDERLVRAIYESSGEGSEAEEQGDEEDDGDGLMDEDDEDEATRAAAATPSKTPRGRGRPPGTRKKSPTPPRDLPPQEMYFFQNKPGLAKTSNNTLSSLDLLTHDEYFTIARDLKDSHEADIQYLQDLHAQSFNQWSFELAEGFSLCLYGFGSKRALLQRFAKHLHSKIQDHDSHKIVVINGYIRTITIREVLVTISAAIDPTAKLTSGQPVALLQDVLSLISSSDMSLTVIINSADAPSLRKSQFQTIFSQLAAHPQVHLACSVDTPDFAALWDSGQRSGFNFAFHDTTTFAGKTAAELDVVDEVHELLGRKARRIGGKDGVAFVLKSLPDNAKNLFQLLVGEVLVVMHDEGGTGGENAGVEYRMLYNKAVEEFICSSEMAFRTLLKEFHDHQMITSRKDILGTEILSLPFRKEELEAILEDLVT